MAEGELMQNTRSSYDRIAERYAREITPTDRKPFDCAQLDRFLNELPDGPIVDLGCGPGDVTRYLRARRREVTGVDLSSEMIGQARIADPSGSYIACDMTALKVNPGSVAGLTAFYSLIHVPPGDLPAALGAWNRALMPGGRLLIAVHIGGPTLHVDTMVNEPVDLDFYFFEMTSLAWALSAAEFDLEGFEEREPYPEIEVQTRRLYALVRKPENP